MEKNIMLENLNIVAQSKKDLENELVDKFTLILNEKKKKIRELQTQVERSLPLNMEISNKPIPTEDIFMTERSQSRQDIEIEKSLNFGSLPQSFPNSLQDHFDIPRSLQVNSASTQSQEITTEKNPKSKTEMNKKTSLSDFLS